MYYALKDNGVPVKFIAFPVSGHSPDDPIHATEIERQYVNWFAQYFEVSWSAGVPPAGSAAFRRRGKTTD